MTAGRAEKLIKWLLSIAGAVALSAVVPMVMPTDWMEGINDRLGLGPFPRTPLTEYLTRSLSAVYALFGALTVYLARNVRRYLELISVVARLTMVLGVVLTVLDASIGMPASWTWGEGPPTVVFGLAILWLARRAGGTADGAEGAAS